MKLILMLVTAVIMLANTTVFAETEPVVHYSFNSEDIIETSTGYEMLDKSGNGYNAYGTDKPNPVETFKSSAYSYTVKSVDGESMVMRDSGMYIPTEVFSGVEDFTMNFWLGSMPSGKIFVGDCADDTVVIQGVSGSGIIRVMSYLENNMPLYEITPEITNADFYSTMHMYTIIQSGSDVKIYFDGVLQGPTLSWTVNQASYTLGDLGMYEGAEFYFCGNTNMDEFTFYNKVLSDEEIYQLYEKFAVPGLVIGGTAYENKCVEVDLTVWNPKENSACIIASYGEYGKLVGVSVEKVSDDMDSTVSVECSEKPTYVKVYLWNSLEEMILQCEAVECEI